jgi:hypothetical protein
VRRASRIWFGLSDENEKSVAFNSDALLVVPNVDVSEQGRSARVSETGGAHRERFAVAENASFDDLAENDDGITGWSLRDEAANDISREICKSGVAGGGFDDGQVEGGEFVPSTVFWATQRTGKLFLIG